MQPLETAIVRSIDVREGQRVRAGQLLARLDATFASADLASLAMQVSTLEAEVARLQAEAEGKAFDYSGLDPSWTLQASIFERRKAVYDAKVENFDRQQDELSSMISRSQSDAEGYQAATRGRRLDRRDAQEARGEAVGEPAQHASLPRTTEPRCRGRSPMPSRRRKQQSASRQPLAADRDGFIQGWRAEVSQSLSEASHRLSEARELLQQGQAAPAVGRTEERSPMPSSSRWRRFRSARSSSLANA